MRTDPWFILILLFSATFRKRPRALYVLGRTCAASDRSSCPERDILTLPMTASGGFIISRTLSGGGHIFDELRFRLWYSWYFKKSFLVRQPSGGV